MTDTFEPTVGEMEREPVTVLREAADRLSELAEGEAASQHGEEMAEIVEGVTRVHGEADLPLHEELVGVAELAERAREEGSAVAYREAARGLADYAELFGETAA